MALNQGYDFTDVEEGKEARREARRISLFGVLIALILGFGLVSLLLYGRILTDDAAVVSTPPVATTTPEAPMPTAPSPNAP